MKRDIATTSSAITQGVRVDVRSQYLEQESQPALRQFVFAYTIRITNEGKDIVQLRTRHWLIEDSMGEIKEVRGDGVVGEQPILHSAESFEYSSGAVIKTERGTMRGSYQMHRPDGSQFDVEIAPFLLERPHSLN